MVALKVGARATIDGLISRADLNGKVAKLLNFDKSAGRWGVRVDGTDEMVRVKAECLTGVAVDDIDEDEDTGVYVHAELNGRRVAVDPGTLKTKFEAIVKKYDLNSGPKSDGIADFLTSDEAGSVSSTEFAERFGMTEEEGEIFLAWLNVGIAFKEQYMDPHEGKAKQLSRGAASAGVL